MRHDEYYLCERFPVDASEVLLDSVDWWVSGNTLGRGTVDTGFSGGDLQTN